MAYGNRYNLLSETVRRIVPVATKLNECGISLRFINYTQDQEFNKISEAKDADRKLAAVKPRGTTKIGTVLRTKIINPVLEKARTGKLVMPVLVVIITDGEPSYELPDTMKKAILYCKQSLEEIQTTKGHVYGGAAVVFQISYIGDSQDAEDFVRNLSTDPEVGNMIHCNLNRLDIQLGAEGNCARNRSVSC
ncbi:hypothetical protein FPQ18DRAFT_258461 [Pyronema domesticum]|nr:hypothetical protein FPQ18DRAFT_258461 [Pyronema domesticum]